MSLVSVDFDLVEARWRLRLTTASDLHSVASELLDDGLSADSLVALFALPSDVAVWEGPELFDRALRELGRGQMTEPEASRIVARHIAHRVLAGTLEPSQATASAAAIYACTGHRFDSFHQLYVLDLEMSYFDERGRSCLGRTEHFVADDVRSEARRLMESENGP